MMIVIRFSGSKLALPIVKREQFDGSPAKAAKEIMLHGSHLNGERACTLKNTGKVSWTDHNGVLIEVSLEPNLPPAIAPVSLLASQ